MSKNCIVKATKLAAIMEISESIYSKQNFITLKRLDYNEPQKSKDQCDRDSVLARNALRRYVDEGNDIVSAEDIYKALLASPITNAKVSGVQFEKV